MVLSAIFSLSLGFLCLSLTLAPAWGEMTVAPPATTPEQDMARGLEAFRAGHFEHAASYWRAAARSYATAQQHTAHSIALTRLGHVYQVLGLFQEATTHLHEALQLAERTADAAQIAPILGSLGEGYLGMRAISKATEYLDRALALAHTSGNTALQAAILNTRGNVFMSQQRPEEALRIYQESAMLARQAGTPMLTARALTHAAMAAMQQGHSQNSQTFLDQAQEHLQSVGATHDKAYEWLNIGLALHQLRAHLHDANSSLLLRAAQMFNASASLAEELGDLRAASYAWGHLGRLYSTEGRHQEALQLTRRAVHAAQHVHAPESLYLWQWQTGRLLKAMGDFETARVAYRQAVETLQSIRTEMSHHYGKPPASFRETLGPLYVERLDLLLQQAAALPPRLPEAQELLEEARHTVKQFKAAELRDYFQDECVDTTKFHPVAIEQVSPSAAVIYPILLPDRIELLLSLPAEGLRRFAVPIGMDQLAPVVKEFRQALREGSEQLYKNLAARLYTWLIRPLEAALASASVQTLVFVPDGPLRTFPLAALYDGTQFLIRKYAVAITPGLDVVEPRPLSGNRLRVLVAGVSVAVQDRPPLPHVVTELEELRRRYDATILHNQNFSLPNLEAALRAREYDVVHIASHGQFASNVNDSHVLMYEGKLTLDQLERVISRLRLRDKPLGLLTLSACETALGDDDRAALGLAGIAIKAGASSALATLWQVNDAATSLLITAFYRHLQQPMVSRAVALQRAQIELLDHPDYQDPFFWAGLLLINNWL